MTHVDRRPPVLIFARSLEDARRFAIAERLPLHRWLFVRRPDQVQGVAGASIAILPGFSENPRYAELDQAARVLAARAPLYRPTATTQKD